MSDKIRKFRSFLKKFKTSEKNITHTIIPSDNNQYGGKYYIPDKHYKEFISKYLEICEIKENKIICPLTITETIPDISPLVIDIDISRESNLPFDNMKKITENIIKTLVKTIKKYYSQKYLMCIVMRREISPYQDEKGKNKDGIHLFFPKFFCDSIFKQFLRLETKEKIHEITTECGNLNSIDSTFDLSVLRVGGRWIIYGSTKNNTTPYEISHVYNFNKNTDGLFILTDITTNYLQEMNVKKLVKIFSVGNYTNCDETELKRKDDKILFKNKISDEINKKVMKRIEKTIDSFHSGEFKLIGMEKYELREIQELLGCLDIKRANEYSDWFNIGQVLFNISSSLLPLWKIFSQKCPEKYSSEVCDNEWEKFEKNKESIKCVVKKGTLRLLAQKDNPEEYGKIRNQHIFDMILTVSISPNHNDIAKILHKMYGKELICNIRNKKTDWYKFNGIIWEKKDIQYHLVNFISNKLVDECNSVIEFLISSASKNNDDFMSTLNDKKRLDIEKFIKLLKTNSYKNQIIKECESVFAEEKFEEKLNKNKNLIALKNGVYDFSTKTFRKARAEDYLSICCDFEYDANAKNSELEIFLNQILPIPELKKYVLELFAITLTGNFLQQLNIFIGVGANGKTSLVELLSKVLGDDYSTPIHPTLITQGQKSSSGPTPEKAKLKDKRLIYMEESDKKDSISVSELKNLLSGGKMQGRFLNENLITFEGSFKMYFLVNNNPYIDTDDYGTWRRIKCIPFVSQFVNNEKDKDEKTKFCFKRVENICDKFDEWRVPFFNILIQHYPSSFSLKEPEIVINETEKYRKSCNYLIEFTSNYITKTEKKQDFLSFPDLYKQFDIWFKIYQGGNTPKSRLFIDQIEANFFRKPREKINGLIGWTGYILNNLEATDS